MEAFGRLDPRQAHLLVEVADSSLEFDLGTKAQIYAKSGFPELWVFDLQHRKSFVHRAPDMVIGRYGQITEHDFAVALNIEAFPEVSVVPAQLLAE